MSYPSGYSEGPYQQVPTSATSGWAIFSLVAGLLSWLGVFGLGGIAAVIAGHISKGQIRSSGGRLTGDGLATAGLILGYANIAFTLVGVCLAVLVVAGVIGAPLLCIPFMNNINLSTY